MTFDLVLLLLSQTATAAATATATPGLGYVDVVADFGADNTGQHDAAPRVRAALLNLTQYQGGGGTLYFRPGSYFFGSQVTISGYGVKVVGSGAVPSACVTQGTTLFTKGANASLLLFKGCTFCSVSRLTLTSASSCSIGGGGTCDTATAVAASIVRHRNQRRQVHKQWYTRQQQQPQQPQYGETRSDLQQQQRQPHQPQTPQSLPAPTMCSSQDSTTPTPTTGAAIEIIGAFQTSISNVWIDSAWIAVYAHSMVRVMHRAHTHARARMHIHTITCAGRSARALLGCARILCCEKCSCMQYSICRI